MPVTTGRCLCGASTWRADGPPLWTTFCHCNDCRRATGAPVTLWVGFAAAELAGDVVWREGRVPNVARASCGRCGSPLAYRDARLPAGEIHFTAGTADAPERLVPQAHSFFPRRLPYVAVTDDLPKFDGGSRPRS